MGVDIALWKRSMASGDGAFEAGCSSLPELSLDAMLSGRASGLSPLESSRGNGCGMDAPPNVMASIVKVLFSPCEVLKFDFSAGFCLFFLVLPPDGLVLVDLHAVL